MKRKLYVAGEINYESYGIFTEQMTQLESESKDPIYVEITSSGGDAYVSLAYWSRIVNSDCKVITVGSGFVASAAVLIFAAGDKRVMTKESWLMVHEEGYTELDGELHDIENQVKQDRRLQDQADMLLASKSNLSVLDWREYHRNTTYLSAAECKKIGLIQEVI